MDFWQEAPGLRDNGQEERACEQITKSLFGNYEGRCFRGKGRMAGATKEALRAATTEQLRKHSRAGRSQTAFSAKTLRAAGLLSVAGVGAFLTARCGALRAAKAALATAKTPRRSAPRSFQTGSKAPHRIPAVTDRRYSSSHPRRSKPLHRIR